MSKDSTLLTSDGKGGLAVGFLLLTLIVVYAVLDLRTSAVTGNVGADRTGVYVALCMVAGLMAAYGVLHGLAHGIRLTATALALLSLTTWILLVNLYRAAEIWDMAVHIGLSVLWILSYCFCYSYVRWNHGRIRLVQNGIFMLMLLYTVATVYYSVNLYHIRHRIPVMNLAYNVIVLLPWLSALGLNRTNPLAYIMVSLAVLISMKRGALIVLSLMVIFGFLAEGVLRGAVRRWLVKLTLFWLFFGLGLYAADRLSGGFLTSRFSLDQLTSGSGRTILYTTAFSDIFSRGLVDFLIGMGSGSSVATLGTGVHNEWLEFLYSFGLIGVLLYAMLYVILLLECSKATTRTPSLLPACTMMLVFMSVYGMIGGIYFMHLSLYVFSFFGVVDAVSVGSRLPRSNMKGTRLRTSATQQFEFRSTTSN